MRIGTIELGGATLRSRVARRVFVLFVLCALVPLGALAFLVFDRVSGQLEEQSERRLRQACKAAAMTLHERLLALDADLRALQARIGEGGLSEAATRLGTRLGLRFQGIGVHGPGVLERLGAPGTTPELAPVEREHIDKGLTLAGAAGPERGVRLVRRLEGGALLWGAALPAFLWGGEGFLVPGTEFLAMDQDGSALFATTPPGEARALLDQALGREPRAGRFSWTLGGEPHQAVYWTLFMRPRFGASWTLVHSEASAEVLRPMRDFRRAFILVAVLSFSVVALLSLTQIRRSLVPIERLREATERVAAGDLSGRVEIRSRDEFAELGRSFNAMLERLLENIERRARVEQELILSRDRALAAARTESQFVTNVSHELRTPLTSIRSFAEILRDYGDEDPETRREFLGIIVAETDRLGRLVEGVLDLGRVQAGSRSWEFAGLDLKASLERALAAQTPAAAEKSLALSLSVPADLPLTAGDPGRIELVWKNLVDNAIKFSPPGGKVEVRARREGMALVVEVEDQGPGIHREHHEVVFERFRQVSPDLVTAKPGGVGLGLAIAREIVRRHRGSIQVVSELGKGALFRVYLPIQTVADLAGRQEPTGAVHP